MAKLLIPINCRRDLCGDCQKRSGSRCDVFDVALDIRNIRGGGCRYVRTAKCVRAEQKVRMLELLVSYNRT
jgi:hypothetical protein